MRFRALALASAILAGLFTCSAAKAVPISYIFSGSGSYSLNGVATTGSFSFTLLGDTANVVFGGTQYTNVIAPGDATFTGLSTVTLLGDVNQVVDNQAAPGFAGFGQIVFSPLTVSAEALINSAFQTYDLKSSLAPTTGTLSVAPATFLTSGGDLTFAEITALSFQAITTSPVPGPEAGAGPLGLFLALGALIAWRRRHLHRLDAAN